MLATIAALMMRRVHLTDDDLQIAEQACRALAERYRQDAQRQRNPVVEKAMIANAQDVETLAERISRFRRSNSG